MFTLLTRPWWFHIKWDRNEEITSFLAFSTCFLSKFWLHLPQSDFHLSQQNEYVGSHVYSLALDPCSEARQEYETLSVRLWIRICVEITHDNGCAACVTLRKKWKWFCFSLYFRALAASAPIWQFPGMVPCGDFYKIVTQDFAASGYNCDANIRMSWKAINNVSSTGKSYGHDGLIYLLFYMSYCRNYGLFEFFRIIN